MSALFTGLAVAYMRRRLAVAHNAAWLLPLADSSQLGFSTLSSLEQEPERAIGQNTHLAGSALLITGDDLHSQVQRPFSTAAAAAMHFASHRLAEAALQAREPGHEPRGGASPAFSPMTSSLQPSPYTMELHLAPWAVMGPGVEPEDVVESGAVSTAELAAAGEPMAQFSNLDELYAQYCQALSSQPSVAQRHTTGVTRDLFCKQVEGELREIQAGQAQYAGDAARSVQAGKATRVTNVISLLHQWQHAFHVAFEACLVQARELVTDKGNKRGPVIAPELWPLLARVGIDRVAQGCADVLLEKLLVIGAAARVQCRSDMGGVERASLARHMAERVEDLIRWGALSDQIAAQDRVSAGEQGAGNQRGAGLSRDDAGKARLRNMHRALQERVDKGMGLGWRDRTAAKKASFAADVVLSRRPWPESLRQQVGSLLVDVALQVATVPASHAQHANGTLPRIHRNSARVSDARVPAIIQHPSTRLGVSRALCPTEPFVDYVLRTGALDAQHVIDSRFMPMRVPPKPWVGLRDGGLLLGQHVLVRGYGASASEWLRTMFLEGRFDQVARGLDGLGRTPWRVNTQVLSVLSKLPNHDFELLAKLGIPTPDVSEPPLPPTAWGEPSRPPATSSAPPAARSRAALRAAGDRNCTPYLRMAREGLGGGQLLFTSGPLLFCEAAAHSAAMTAHRQARVNAMSLVSEHVLRLSVAEQLASWPRFWFPHFIDFRGRAYPFTSYLTHHGDDVGRGLLQFAEGKPLGRHGLRWLFIQLANCYGNGMDKLSLDERASFGESRVALCAASAANPLTGPGSWWQEGDDPWQLLATALEVHAAVTSGDPANYVSHQPVHQDGSCNGLQHYAALARDVMGGAAVNLLPSAAPQDVYAAVAREVQAVVVADAAGGSGRSEAVKLLARNGGVVDRKLVKQTVMTTVYGVTFMGARDQIAARLHERGWTNESEQFQVACYLASVTLACVGRVFTNAEPVKQWLATVASRTTATGKPVTWTSPLGFPCQQPYYKSEVVGRVRTSSVRDKGTGQVTTHQVDKRRQRTAFPPNYIHGLDAAHMMMTAQACEAAGVTFAGVHDSFMTHAASVDDLGRLLREQFVALHSQPLLERLASELEQQGAIDLPPVPPRGDLDVHCVLDSPYFFA